MAKRKKRDSMVDKASNSVIAWAFIVGVLIAILIGLFGKSLAAYQGTLVTLLILAGIVVGLFKISARETNNYLIAVVSIVIVTSMAGNNLGQISGVGTHLVNVFNALMAFIVPTVLVVGLKAVYYLSKN